MICILQKVKIDMIQFPKPNDKNIITMQYAVANMQIKRLDPTIITFTHSEYFVVSTNCFITLNLMLVGFFLMLVSH